MVMPSSDASGCTLDVLVCEEQLEQRSGSTGETGMTSTSGRGLGSRYCPYRLLMPYFPVRTTVQHFHPEFAPIYEAIPYMRENVEKDSKILTGANPFSTTTSAFNVLRSRSSLWKTTIIWIGSVCINEDDNEEKRQ